MIFGRLWFMNIKKIFLSSLVSLLTVSVINTVSVYAKSNNNFGDIKQMAKNAPTYVLGYNKEWKNTTAFNVKQLYDFNNKLVAYSVDLKSNVNNEPAYAIISASEEDAPIIEFCEGHLSPYDKVNSDQKCIYDQITSYYSKSTSDNTYYDIKNSSKLSDKVVEYLIAKNKNKKYVSSKPSSSKSERAKLKSKAGETSDITPSIILSSKILSVPDYEWQCGCAPTAAAMVLKYTYSSALSSVSSSTLISKLASAMGTSGGSTYTSNIPSGIKSVMSSYGKSVTTWNDYDGKGKSGNDIGEYCDEIDANHPIILNVYGSTETAPSYPSGFGDHSMAGVGYQLTTSYSYIVVHDTGVDGNVYCNYDSSAFGTPWFTYVH